jgi:uncharacterized protein YjbI with pentapeptide repeats
MARLFEGVLAIWGNNLPYERRGRFVLHLDVPADMAYLRIEQDGRWTSDEMSVRISEFIRRLDPVRASEHAVVAEIFSEGQDAPHPTLMAMLRDHAPLSSLVGDFPKFQLEMPGISSIRQNRGCNDVVFRKIAGADVALAGFDFSGMSFRNVDFTGASIANTTFLRTRFDNCRFGSTQLTGHRLDGANLRDQRFENLDFTGTNFDGADLGQAMFTNCTMNGAILKNAKIDKTAFWTCSCTGTHFENAKGSMIGFINGNLDDAKFDDADIDGWFFPGVKMTNTSFKNAKLTNAVFSQFGESGPPPTISNIDLDNADLSGADFTDVSLLTTIRHARLPRLGKSATSRTRLVRARFKLSLLGTDASYIDATDATITFDVAAATGITEFKAVHALFPTRMPFAGFKLSRADFSHARLPEARFGNATLRNAKFNGAHLDGADFTSAKLDGVEFNDAVVTAVNFTSAWLYGAKFERTTLANANFSTAMLAEVNFAALEGRSLAAVNFSNACLAQADFTSVKAARQGTVQTSFSNACLAGTIFTGANLADVLLTNAQVSTAKGMLVVEVPDRDKKEIHYDPTLIAPSITGPQTTCPDGNSGPCTIERLTFKPVRAKWPG